MIRPLFTLAFTVSAALLAGCLFDSTGNAGPESIVEEPLGGDTLSQRCSEADCGPFEFRQAFWPLAIGNSWVYIDSAFTAQGALLIVDTLAISVTQLNPDSARGEYWWVFSGAGSLPFPSTDGRPNYLMQRHDTIFSLEGGMFEPGYTTQAKLGPIPASKDSVMYFWTYGGDVAARTVGVRNGPDYKTPAGTFTGSLSYDFSALQRKSFVFKPGVGILGYDYETGLVPKARHRGRLLEYSLKP